MDPEKLLQSLSLKEKLFQMFILGFSGTEFNKENENIRKAIKSGLGGVILFSENIDSYDQTARLTESLRKTASIPLFISIDQEGGRVERTGNIKNKIKYLSAGELAAMGNNEYARIQAEAISQELNYMGCNMNFAPVMDVNTNENNPIIGIRAFGSNSEKVMEYAAVFYKTFIQNSIIPVVKHFPGHGPTEEDSHLTMPYVGLSCKELEATHIKPFKKALQDGVNAVMISHVHFRCFNTGAVPASLSKEVVTGYLRQKLGFNGLVISDDMVMGGVQNYYSGFEACMKGINAGIDVFIYRNSTDETIKIIEDLCKVVNKGDLSEKRINESVKRILLCKKKSGLWKKSPVKTVFKPEELQKKLDKIISNYSGAEK